MMTGERDYRLRWRLSALVMLPDVMAVTNGVGRFSSVKSGQTWRQSWSTFSTVVNAGIGVASGEVYSPLERYTRTLVI